MTSDTLVYGLVALTVLATLALARWYPTLVRDRFVEPIDGLRTLIGILVGIAFIWHALNSGVTWMILLALAGVAFVTGYLYFEQPHNDIR